MAGGAGKCPLTPLGGPYDQNEAKSGSELTGVSRLDGLGVKHQCARVWIQFLAPGDIGGGVGKSGQTPWLLASPE